MLVHPKDYPALKIAYKLALERGDDSFMFKGGELVTSFAKYVLEYLLTQYPHLEKKGE